MQRIAPLPMDRRLEKRYWKMVHSHMNSAEALAAGVKSLPDGGSSLAAVQAGWRFLNNERISFSALVQPLRETACRRAESIDSPFMLLVHDWCKLSFTWKKDDEIQLTHSTDVGYELTTALLVDPDDGSPLAPMEMHLETAEETLSTRHPAPHTASHLEQVLPTMEAAAGWKVPKPLVHVIDREADSIDHYRRWDVAEHMFLVRADDRRVLHHGDPKLLSEIGGNLRRKKAFRHVGQGEFHGRKAQLWVAETQVVLHRPARKNVNGRKYERPGSPLELRLIVVQLRNTSGRVLAQWMLLSNVPVEWADAAQLGRCYYWRWRIESFFKLLKTHGHQLEQWQQQTGPAIARRLLIAAMACVVVWELQADDSQEADELKDILIRLSGRQMKRGRPHTAPALLAGLWNLLSILALLEHNDLSDLQRLHQAIPILDSG